MPFMAGGAALGAVTSIVGGGKQASATRDAATTQANAANRAADLQNSQFQQTQQNEQPFVNAGSNALSQLQSAMPGLTQGFDPTQHGLTYTFNPFDYGTTPTFSYAAKNNPNPASFAYDQTSFQNDPAFAASMKYGTQAIERSAAAKGQSLDPATMKALQSYGQDTAQQYYGQDYSRAQNTYQQNYSNAENTYNQDYSRAQQTYQNNYSNLQNNYNQEYATAFNTFTNNQNSAFNKLASVAGLGQSAASMTGQLGAQSAMNQGNALMSAGNSQSAGIIGGANAFNNGLGGVSANIQQLMGNSQFQGWAKGNSSSYGQTMTPYNPTYPTNSNGF